MKSIEELMALRDAAKAKMTARDDSTEITRIAMDRKLASTASGCRIFPNEDFASSKPIRRIRRETIRPVRYSIRPWPKG